MIGRRTCSRLQALLLTATFCTGCQTVQLREGSLNQAASYGEVQEQQVLDNLAKFVYDINSMPSFAYSAQGTHQVQDQLSLGSVTTWSRIAGGIYGWASSTGSPMASRQAFQNWVLQPLNDPRKLDLMRCAYQQVVRANRAARGLPDTAASAPCDGGSCPDCAKRFNTFYTGDPSKPTPPPGDGKDKGRVTNFCLGTNPCWFEWGCKRDLPKNRHCLKYGHYCGVYVWVTPDGRDELTKLTFAILDYAVNAPVDPSAVPKKQVTYYVDADGNRTSESKAVGKIIGEMPVTSPSVSLLVADLPIRAGLEDSLNQVESEREKLRSDKSEGGTKRLSELSDQAELLRNQLNTLTIPAQQPPYRPSVDELSGPNLLQFQLRLQSVQPAPSLTPVP